MTLLSFLATMVISSRRNKTPLLHIQDFTLVIVYVVGRAIAIILFHFIIKLPVRGDLIGWYIDGALKISEGGVPYKDFVSPYGFLFSYLIYLLLEIWHSHRSVILFGLAMDAVMIAFLLACMRICNVAPTRRLLVVALVFFNPLQFSHATILGSNQHWLAAVAAVAFYFILRKWELIAAIMLGSAVAWVKFTIGLFVLPFLVSVRRPVAFLAACGGTVILYLLTLWVFRIDPFVPLRNQFLSYDELMSNNVWFYLELILSRQSILILSKILLLGLMSAITMFILAIAYRGFVEQAPGNYELMLSLLVLVWSCVMAFSPKSNSWYFVAVIPFAYWWAIDVAEHKRIHYLITLYGALACLNMSMHSLLFGEEPVKQVLQRGTFMAWTFLGIDFAMLLMEIVLILQAAFRLLHDRQLASSFRSTRAAPSLRK